MRIPRFVVMIALGVVAFLATFGAVQAYQFGARVVANYQLLDSIRIETIRMQQEAAAKRAAQPPQPKPQQP